MAADQPSDPVLEKRIARTARCFDATCRLLRWPSRRADQELALWIVWSQMPSDGQLSELDVNAMLRTWHDYEDYVLLRRELCELDLLRRKIKRIIYRRVTHDMPPEAEALLARLEAAAS